MGFLAQYFMEDGNKKEEDEMWEIREIFMSIGENLNAIRRVYKGDSCGLTAISVL
jgi:hypothetical protein